MNKLLSTSFLNRGLFYAVIVTLLSISTVNARLDIKAFFKAPVLPKVNSPSSKAFEIDKANQDPGDFSVEGFAANDVLLISIGLVNPPTGVTFSLSTTTGLTRSTGYNSWTNLSRISFTGSQESVNNALASLAVSTGSNEGDVKISVSATLNESGYFYNPVNGHYYKPVSWPSTGRSGGASVYNQILGDAAAMTYKGVAGYLATITSTTENDFINKNSSASNVLIGLSDKDTEGQFKWDSGPEAGTIVRNGTSNVSGMYNNWASGEPNNWGSGEDFVVTNWSGGSTWNDYGPPATNFPGSIRSYMVEFGTWTDPDDNTFTDFYSGSTNYQITKCTPFKVDDFQLNGNSSYADNIYTLTPDQGNRSGSFWFKKKLDLDSDFEFTTKVFLGNNDSGADGIAFVLQDLSLNAGSAGGGLGYAGVSPSFAVEFDTYNNGGHEPKQDHIALIANGATSGAHGTYSNPYEVQMEDGKWHSAKFMWNASTKKFQMWYDGTKVHDITIDLKATIFGGKSYVYWGFTGATGGAKNLQQVQIQSYCLAQQIDAPSSLSYNPSTQTVRQSEAITQMLPNSSGGAVDTYSISPTLPSGITLNTSTGSISGTTTQALTGSVTYTVTATNTTGSTTAEITLVFNTAPTDISISAASIAENKVFGTDVGTLSSTDSDTGDEHTYSLVSGTGSTDNDQFTIDGNKLKSAVSFDFETKSSYSVRIKTLDKGGLSFEKALTITVVDANDAPTNLVLSVSTIQENKPIGELIGTLSSSDVDTGDEHTYSLVSGTGSTDNARFTIDGNSLKSAVSFDFEKNSSYSIRIKTLDKGGLSFEKSITITVVDVNEAPSDLILSPGILYENNAVGAVIGNLSSTDQDAGDKHTYTLISGDVAAVRISGNQLLANASYIFRNKNTYSVVVNTTDAGGLSLNKTLTIRVLEEPFVRSTVNLPRNTQMSVDGKNVTISKGYSANLNVIGTNLVRYEWSPGTGLSSTTISNPVAKPGQTTTYTVTVTNAQGNSTKIQVTVVVLEDYNITPNNIISPDGDGVNDVWFIENLEAYPSNEVKIFDKSGRIIYNVRNYQNNWNGQLNGLVLHEGAYYYIINLGSGTNPKVGYINLISNR